jgi:hypothetical protein
LNPAWTSEYLWTWRRIQDLIRDVETKMDGWHALSATGGDCNDTMAEPPTEESSSSYRPLFSMRYWPKSSVRCGELTKVGHGDRWRRVMMTVFLCEPSVVSRVSLTWSANTERDSNRCGWAHWRPTSGWVELGRPVIAKQRTKARPRVRSSIRNCPERSALLAHHKLCRSSLWYISNCTLLVMSKNISLFN